MAIHKIISGGQTGADRAALYAARAWGTAVGGWIPAGRIAEDGQVPREFLELVETATDAPEERTALNVRDSDGTLIVSHGALTGGSALTLEQANELRKPALHLDLDRTARADAIRQALSWIRANQISCLNVAGPRASEDPRAYDATFAVVFGLLASMSFQLRDARLDDVSALARLHMQTFNEAHRGGRSGGPSYELREQQWREAFATTERFWFCLVVEDDAGELVAFAKGTLHDGGVSGFAGELNKIYALKRLHRRGLGRLLLAHVAQRFLDHGITSMLLFGDGASPTNGFYEAFGAERLYGVNGEFHGSYGWRDLRLLAERCGTP